MYNEHLSKSLTQKQALKPISTADLNHRCSGLSSHHWKFFQKQKGNKRKDGDGNAVERKKMEMRDGKNGEAE